MAEEYWGWILDVFYFSNEKYFIFWKNIVRDGSWNGGLFRSFYFRMFDGWKVGDGFSRHVLFSNICVREIWGWILDVLRRVKCFEHLCTRNILFLLESWNGELIVVLFSNI